ncbi:EthD domain-containing protein [Kibdelosporangium philippinense]|uniref:EthD domain-containing protein n=1 Tax=Kibdelosporangium philippinense TaxID=211113 RepID=A0ABS8ZAU6_9PSEU|nr:EthD domain-containing protein [Kibdelosporangium philippinense]MCE7004996.1 EthD domain-containing protein [Kibdelosporangium philippinense]
MYKWNEFLTRRADLSKELFDHYWTNVHAPLVMSIPEVKRYTLRYVQQHNTGLVLEGVAAAPYDGVVEVWFEDMADFQAIASSGKWDAALKDVENFADVSKTAVLNTTEEVIYDQ